MARCIGHDALEVADPDVSIPLRKNNDEADAAVANPNGFQSVLESFETNESKDVQKQKEENDGIQSIPPIIMATVQAQGSRLLHRVFNRVREAAHLAKGRALGKEAISSIEMICDELLPEHCT